MGTINLALVVESPRVQAGEATEVAAALQRQISRDFSPLWRIEGTIDAFHALEDVPPGYWPILVRTGAAMKGILGIHLDERGQPFALVRDIPQWPFIASHEVLEMLADPHGNRLIPGGSLKPGQGLVDYLVEVCDPCVEIEFGYSVNGILVSDFITPNFYDPIAVPGVRYSFSGNVERPRSLLPGGYVAFREPATGDWWIADQSQDYELTFRALGPRPFDGAPLRATIDQTSSLSLLSDDIDPDNPTMRAARVRYESSKAASRANAAAINRQIAVLTAQYPPAPPSLMTDPAPQPDSRGRARRLDGPDVTS